MYAHPSADDFTYGNHTVFTWRETNSVSQTISAAVEGTKQVYNNWQGSFVSVFFMTLHPAVFSEGLYMFGLLALILGYVAANLFLFKIIFMNFLGADKYSAGIIAMWFAFISMQFIFSPIEGFYWYNSGLYYIGFHTISLILFSVVLLWLKAEEKYRQIILAILTVFLSFIIGGSNFVTSLTSVVIMALILAFCVIFKREKILAPALGLLVLSVALTISVSAPGNDVRQEHFTAMNPLSAIFTSFEYGFTFIELVIKAPVLLALGCITPLIYIIMRESKISFKYPVLATVIFYGVYVSTFTPNLYSWSSFGPARVVNINFIAFLFYMIFSIGYWCGWISRNVKTRKKKSKFNPAWITAVFIFAFIIASGFSIFKNPDSVMSISVAKSIISGEARTFRNEYLTRLEILKNPEIQNAELPAFSVNPHVFFHSQLDVSTDPHANSSIAIFYNKESVVLVNSQ
jgi:hypothetical protein